MAATVEQRSSTISEQAGNRPEPATVAPVEEGDAGSALPHPAEDRTPVPFSFAHMFKTIGLAIALTGLFMLPQFIIHIPTGIIAPISAGYTTGGIMKVSPLEALIIGFALFLLISLPAPVAYLAFGFANHLPLIAIAAFSLAFGAYYGTLIGVFSWIGGNWRH